MRCSVYRDYNALPRHSVELAATSRCFHKFHFTLSRHRIAANLFMKVRCRVSHPRREPSGMEKKSFRAPGPMQGGSPEWVTCHLPQTHRLYYDRQLSRFPSPFPSSLPIISSRKNLPVVRWFSNWISALDRYWIDRHDSAVLFSNEYLHLVPFLRGIYKILFK